MAIRIPNRMSIAARVSSLGRKFDRGLPGPAGQHSAVLAAHPIEPGTFFAAWERNIFRSADAGASWERLDVSLAEGSRVNEMCALVVAEM